MIVFLSHFQQFGQPGDAAQEVLGQLRGHDLITVQLIKTNLQMRRPLPEDSWVKIGWKLGECWLLTYGLCLLMKCCLRFWKCGLLIGECWPILGVLLWCWMTVSHVLMTGPSTEESKHQRLQSSKKRGPHKKRGIHLATGPNLWSSQSHSPPATFGFDASLLLA